MSVVVPTAVRVLPTAKGPSPVHPEERGSHNNNNIYLIIRDEENTKREAGGRQGRKGVDPEVSNQHTRIALTR